MKKLTEWDWIYLFFRSSLNLNGPKATRAANLITGENREMPDKEEMIERIKPVLAQVHDVVGCKVCKPEGEQPMITRN